MISYCNALLKQLRLHWKKWKKVQFCCTKTWNVEDEKQLLGYITWITCGPNYYNSSQLTYPTAQMAARFVDDIFKCIFIDEKFLYFVRNLTEVCSGGSNRQDVSIGSGNDLAPNRRQAISWTNADLVHLRIYAALGEKVDIQETLQTLAIFRDVQCKWPLCGWLYIDIRQFIKVANLANAIRSVFSFDSSCKCMPASQSNGHYLRNEIKPVIDKNTAIKETNSEDDRLWVLIPLSIHGSLVRDICISKWFIIGLDDGLCGLICTIQKTYCINHTMHQFHILQCTILQRKCAHVCTRITWSVFYLLDAKRNCGIPSN